MNSTVKFVFLMIMGAIVAIFLYWLFFGTVGLTGQEMAGQTDATGKYQMTNHFDGILMNSARIIETPISAYYYYYCYLPVLYNNVYVDKELSGNANLVNTRDFVALVRPNGVDNIRSNLADSTYDIYTIPDNNVDSRSLKIYDTNFQ